MTGTPARVAIEPGAEVLIDGKACFVVEIRSLQAILV